MGIFEVEEVIKVLCLFNGIFFICGVMGFGKIIIVMFVFCWVFDWFSMVINIIEDLVENEVGDVK